jgi:glucan 1,4-alpha-glucosidase
MKSLLLTIAALPVLLHLHAQPLGSISSPNNELTLIASTNQNGEVFYTLAGKNGDIIKLSKLGVTFKEGAGFASGMRAGKVTATTTDETWQPVWGEESEIRDQYSELRVEFIQPAMKNAGMMVTFRLYNEGLGFRYEWPAQKT